MKQELKDKLNVKQDEMKSETMSMKQEMEDEIKYVKIWNWIKIMKKEVSINLNEVKMDMSNVKSRFRVSLKDIRKNVEKVVS